MTTTVTGSPAPTARSLAADPFAIGAWLLLGTWRSRTVNALLVLGGLAWAAWLTGVLG